MKDKIVVIGSSNTDMVVKSERIPVPGETILGGTFMMNPGGKGANQAVAAARLGGNVTFIAKAGNDIFGRQAVEGYKKDGINTGFIFTDAENPSGVALITVDSKGENCIVVAPGANASLDRADIDIAREEIENAGIVLMQLETPMDTVCYAAEMAAAKGIKVVLNPAPAAMLPDKLLENLYMLIPNETEAEILSGVKVTDCESACRAASVISSKGVDIVVVTMGSRGALVKSGGDFYEVPSVKVKAVDTTAAGDTFCGALCVALSEGRDIADAVRFANKCASVSVTRMGAQASVPYRREIDF